METKTSTKDFFLNLGAIVALYVTAVSFINLLFTVINSVYPPVGYSYFFSSSISLPVATLIIFFPIFILLMWLLERGFASEPEKRNVAIRRWLTYITLFVAGLALAIDLVTVLYRFLDGQELTAGFLLKALSVLVVASAVFIYYISDIRGKLNGISRKIWAWVVFVVVLASIVWGFLVLGSPRTQQLLKYDQQKVSDLQSINSEVMNYYSQKGSIPSNLSNLSSTNNYFVAPKDPQSGVSYEYVLIGQSAKAYQLCAVFNKSSSENNPGQYPTSPAGYTWVHPAGHYCFNEVIPLNQYVMPQPAPIK